MKVDITCLNYNVGSVGALSCLLKQSVSSVVGVAYPCDVNGFMISLSICSHFVCYIRIVGVSQI